MKSKIHTVSLGIFLAAFLLPSCWNGLHRKNGKYILRKKGPFSTVLAKGHYKNGEMDGQWLYYYDNGHLKQEINYSVGKPNGVCRMYDHNDSLVTFRKWKNGLKDGEWMEYSPGHWRRFTNYSDDKMNGIYREYAENGTLLQFCNYRNDTLSGMFYSWNDNGVPLSSGQYLDGEKDGIWRQGVSHLDSTFYEKIGYSNGIMVSTERYRKGKMIFTASYDDDGRKNGTFFRLNDNGDTGFVANYHNGIPYGYFIMPGQNVYADHFTSIRGFYSGGKRNGLWSVTDEFTGKRTEEWYFTNDRTDSAHIYDNGNLTDILHFKNDSLDGKYFRYYPHGSLAVCGNFKQGYASGPWTVYYSNGVKFCTGQRQKDTLSEFTVYDWNGKAVMKMKNGKTGGRFPLMDSIPATVLHFLPGRDTMTMNAAKASPGNLMGWPMRKSFARPDGLFEDSVSFNYGKVFSFAEIMPTFPGGDDAFKLFLAKNIVYPQQEKEAGKQGTVYISYIVNTDGKIADVHVIKDVPGAPGLAKAALKVISSMPYWNPGMQDGIRVRVQMVVPVKFVLE